MSSFRRTLINYILDNFKTSQQILNSFLHHQNGSRNDDVYISNNILDQKARIIKKYEKYIYKDDQ